jgi:hypothetical protein
LYDSWQVKINLYFHQSTKTLFTKKKSWAEFGEEMKNAYRENQTLFFEAIKNTRKNKVKTFMNIKDEI